jgi:thiol-disulfide isomerase/thioredoxin
MFNLSSFASRARRSRWVLGALMLGCGGGRVDPGFRDGTGDATGEARSGWPSVSGTARLTEGKPAVVVIRSETCGPCRRAERAMLPALEPYRDRIDLVVLDVTDDEAEAASLETARSLDILDFFLEHRRVTPSIGLISRHGRLRPYTGNTFGRRTWERTFAEMVEAR